MHQPVLLQETIEGLNLNPKGRYIDATAGEGGHLEVIINNSLETLALDRDEKQIALLEKKFIKAKNVRFAVGNFADIEIIAKQHSFLEVNGILIDLGLSMRQLSESGKGLSYKKLDEPLDMRLDVKDQTAADIVNTFDQQKLYEMLARNAEEPNSLTISKGLVRDRGKKKIETVSDVIKSIDNTLGSSDVSTYARVFQALRMEVNNELENVKKGLEGAIQIIRPNGRIAVITFHSVEDRIVKQFIREKGLKQVHKKAITSGSGLSFERSAKLRIFTNI